MQGGSTLRMSPYLAKGSSRQETVRAVIFTSTRTEIRRDWHDAQRELRVVIPAYNESARIGRCVEEYCSHFGTRAVVVVVANGCRDGTAEIVRGFMGRFENLRLIEIQRAIGKGGAVRVGLKTGDEPYIGFTDADGSTTAADFDSLLQTCRETGSDGAIGSRWIRGASVKRRQPLRRRIFSRGFNFVVRLFFNMPYSDTQCGAKLFRRPAIDRVIGELELADFAFDIDLLYAFKRFGFRVVECPILWEDFPDDSKIRLLPAAWTMLLSVARLRARHGFLHVIPYGDLIARSAVISVERLLSIVVVSRRPRGHAANDALDARLEAWALAWEAQGHAVRWIAPRGLREILSACSWYLRRGHAEVDAIIDNDSSISWLTAFSIKPKLCLAPLTPGRDEIVLRRQGLGPIPVTGDGAQAVLDRLRIMGTPFAFFSKIDGAWRIGFRSEGTEAESISI
jgi:glycosyltransferase involved in cell wall biosynthesis